MATVPRAQRQVRRTAKAAIQRRTAETPESQGAGVGQAIAAVGDTATRLGVRTYLDETARIRDESNQVAHLGALKRISDWKLKAVHGEGGALNRRGRDAFELPEQIESEFDQVADEIETSLSTTEQRVAFQRARLQERESLLLTVQAHVDRERKTFDEQQYSGFVSNQKALSVAQASDPATGPIAVNESLRKVVAATVDYGTRHGMAPEAIEAAVGAARNEMWSGAIQQALAKRQAALARSYFDEASDAGQLTGEALTRMQEALKRGVADITGEESADSIWTELGPKGDQDAIHLDQMEAAARTRHKGDPDALQATIDGLRSRKQAADASRADRREVLNSSLWGAAVQGATLDQIKRLPQWQQAPGELQQRVADYFRQQTDREESRRVSAESRAAASEGRLDAAEARRERALERDGWARYFDLARPEALRQMTPGQIMERLPELGHAHVGRLLNELEQLGKDDTRLRAATVDQDVLFEEMADAGLAYVHNRTKQPHEKANIGKLEALVKDEIGRAQQQGRRELTRDEKRALVRSVLDRKVMVDTDFWFDSEQIAALVNPEDHAKAYVPLARISGDVVSSYANYLIGEFPTQFRTVEDVRTKLPGRLERAYALHLLGYDNAAVRKALKGQ